MKITTRGHTPHGHRYHRVPAFQPYATTGAAPSDCLHDGKHTHTHTPEAGARDVDAEHRRREILEKKLSGCIRRSGRLHRSHSGHDGAECKSHPQGSHHFCCQSRWCGLVPATGTFSTPVRTLFATRARSGQDAACCGRVHPVVGRSRTLATPLYTAHTGNTEARLTASTQIPVGRLLFTQEAT
jgi:hypothetical protein